MPVNRAAPTPQFFEFVTHYVLVDATGALPMAVQGAGLYNLTKLHIPTFQRGISWDVSDVLDFLRSRSQVVGHAILANLPTSTTTELVDGLQRFTVGTALLEILYPLVLSPTCSYQLLKPQFLPLANYTNNAQAVFSSNHQQLFNHPRRAVQDQYRDFYSSLSDYVTRLLAGQNQQLLAEFTSTAVNTFCGRQIAIDVFSGFSGMTDLINTFLGINTIRVELNTIDLLRTHIVEKATQANWPPTDVEHIENLLTDVFMKNGAVVKSIMPLATAVQNLLPTSGVSIFPNWISGITRTEVEDFLDFVDACVSASTSSAYLGEIAEVGALPFSIVVLFYYRMKVSNGQSPSFVAQGFASSATQEDAELHLFVRASYRCMLAGIVGQLGPIADSTISSQPVSLAQISNQIGSLTASGSLAGAPTPGWIAAQLEGVNKDKAKRVFNACLLPLSGNAGGSFTPIAYGRSANKWQIDHLIPDSLLAANQPGVAEGQRIRNFAPILSQYNQSARNTPAAQKLAPNGLYDQMLTGIANNGHTAHPFLVWLSANQSAMGTHLNDQTKLLPNANPAIGDNRIQYVEQLLSARL
jgi:hypothetical protein